MCVCVDSSKMSVGDKESEKKRVLKREKERESWRNRQRGNMLMEGNYSTSNHPRASVTHHIIRRLDRRPTAGSCSTVPQDSNSSSGSFVTEF